MTADFRLVIPCLNESERLPRYLAALVAALDRCPYHTHILLVDDGSRSEEQARLRQLAAVQRRTGAVSVGYIALPRNMGKGRAIREGWSAPGDARWLAFADADGATAAAEVVRVFDMVFQQNDPSRCYLGSRVKMLGRVVERHWYRHAAGRVFATFVSLATREPVYDSQCGFKIIPRAAFAAVGSRLIEDRFAFDPELIGLLRYAGYSFEEVPVDWTDVAGSKVSPLKDPLRMIFSLLALRRRLGRLPPPPR